MEISFLTVRQMDLPNHNAVSGDGLKRAGSDKFGNGAASSNDGGLLSDHRHHVEPAIDGEFRDHSIGQRKCAYDILNHGVGCTHIYPATCQQLLVQLQFLRLFNMAHSLLRLQLVEFFNFDELVMGNGFVELLKSLHS